MDPVKQNILLIIIGSIGMIISIVLGFCIYKKENIEDYVDFNFIKYFRKSKLKKAQNYRSERIKIQTTTGNGFHSSSIEKVNNTELINEDNVEESNDTVLLDTNSEETALIGQENSGKDTELLDLK